MTQQFKYVGAAASVFDAIDRLHDGEFMADIFFYYLNYHGRIYQVKQLEDINDPRCWVKIHG